MSRKRVAVLISGRGSNMAALIEAAKDKTYPAEIVLVVSNKPDASGLATARTLSGAGSTKVVSTVGTGVSSTRYPSQVNHLTPTTDG